MDLEDYDLLDETYTPASYIARLKNDFMLNGISWVLNLLLFTFLILHKEIWNSLKSTIVFVTTGSLILNIPLLVFQTWMVCHIVIGIQPTYTIMACSFYKNFFSGLTSSFQVLPFAVSIYRYKTVVLKSRPGHYFVYYVHSMVTLFFMIVAFLSYPIGVNIHNDVCYVLRFSINMELTRIFSTLFFNLAAIFLNCLILKFVISFRKQSTCLQKKQKQLTQSLLIQSLVPPLVSLPLLLGSFEFYLDFPGLHVLDSFAATWYVTTFLDPILMPLSSVLGIRKTRHELINTIFCVKKKTVQPSTTVTVTNVKTENGTLTVRDDE